MTRSVLSSLAVCGAVLLATAPTGIMAQDGAAGRISLPFSILPTPGGDAQAPGTVRLNLASQGKSAPEPGKGLAELFGPRIGLVKEEPQETKTVEAAEPEILHPITAMWPLDPGRLSNGVALLEGERDRTGFALFVPEGAQPKELLISAVSSAFIMPNRSELRVYTEDRLIGTMPLTSITGTETARLPLTPGTLKAGVNRLRVEVALTHRLYCGVRSSYDLWTKIDLSGSGIAIDPATVAPGPASFIAAVSAARGQGKPLLIAGSDLDTSQSTVLTISRQLAAAAGGGLDFTTRPGTAGDAPAPKISIRKGDTPNVSFGRDEDGRQTVTVTTTDRVIPALFSGTGFESIAEEIPEIPRDVPVEISRLGFETVQISEYLWRNRLEFRLPSEWLMNVTKRAVFNLNFAHLPGLPTGSEMRLKVNGHVVRIVPMDRGGRLNEIPLEIRFNAGLLRAGRNTLGLEVNIPGDPADQPCPLVSVGRVEINGNSTLTVPGTPNMHLPGLTRWLSEVQAPDISFAGLAGESVNWTMLPRLASVLQTGSDSDPEESREVIVHRPMDLNKDALGDFNIGRQVMLAALQTEATPARPSLATAATEQTGLTFSEEEPGRFTELVDAGKVISASVWTDLTRLAFPDPASDLADWLSMRRGQALLFQLDSGNPETVHLVLSADARPDSVLAGLERMRHSETPVDGHMALLTWEGEWETWTDTTRMPILVGELNEKNWRGVVGNFASARPVLAVGTLTAIALLSVIFANSYVRASRRRT